MTLKTLFEREVFVRVGEDQSTLICTTKWRFLSVSRRFGIGKARLVPRTGTELDAPGDGVQTATPRREKRV